MADEADGADANGARTGFGLGRPRAARTGAARRPWVPCTARDRVWGLQRIAAEIITGALIAVVTHNPACMARCHVRVLLLPHLGRG